MQLLIKIAQGPLTPWLKGMGDRPGEIPHVFLPPALSLYPHRKATIIDDIH